MPFLMIYYQIFIVKAWNFCVLMMKWGAVKRRRVETEFPSKMLTMEIAYSAWLDNSTRQPGTGRIRKRVYIIYGRAKNASG